jgi:UDP-glucose 4-epimerase
MEKIKVLITGICGFIGVNLSRALLKRGYDVDGIDNLSVGTKEYLPEGVSNFYRGNVAHRKYFLKNAGIRDTKYDMIIHLASRKIPRMGGGWATITQNLAGTKNAILHALNDGARLIFASTSDVYGKNTSFTEDSYSVIGSTKISRWTYAISKLAGESMLYQSDLNFNIIRYFGSYGPYHALSWTAGPQSVFISQALRSKPLPIHGDGTQSRCFSYIDDIIDGTVRVIESNYERDVFNIGNPNEEISIIDLGEKIWRLIHARKKYRYDLVPHSAFAYEEIPARVPNIDKAQQLLGYEPTVSLEEGLIKTIEWQKSMEDIKAL